MQNAERNTTNFAVSVDSCVIMCNLHVNGEFKQRRFEKHMLTLIELLFSCTVVLGEFSGELFL